MKIKSKIENLNGANRIVPKAISKLFRIKRNILIISICIYMPNSSESAVVEYKPIFLEKNIYKLKYHPQKYRYRAIKMDNDFELLKEKDILPLISNRFFKNDSEKNKSSFQFSEYYYEDGTWKMIRQQRSLTQIIGKWSIKNDNICVETRGSEICREIIKDNKIDRFMIKDLYGGKISPDFIYISIGNIQD